MKNLLIVILVVAAALGGWWVGRQRSMDAVQPAERKIAFYQSPMHPWIKSDKPGNCTICGMKLTPVYEGEKGFDTTANMVTLSSNAINVINVQVETAERRPLRRTLEVAGRVEADQTRSRVISAYVDGRIEKLFVNFNGAQVQEGEPLALLYSPALLTAEREYRTALAQTNQAGSPRLGEEQRNLVGSARQRLKRLGLTDEQIESLGRNEPATNLVTQIVAPLSGTVIKRDVLEGQYVKEGDRLFELIDLSQLWFVFEVYEQDLPMIQPGQKVRVTSPSLPGKSFEGPIAFIEPTVNETTRSVRVRVDLQNPLIDGKRDLYSGLYGVATIRFESEPVLTVSRGAVLEPGDQARVYVDHGGGAYEQRPVDIGRKGTNYVEILSGLEAGEKIVSSGSLLLDSQAQIIQAANGHTHEPGRGHENQPAKIDPATVPELGPYFEAMSKLAEALANDDVKTYNERAADLPVPQVPALESLASALKSSPAGGLEEARLEFLPLSLATANIAQAAKASGADPGVKIFKCPMFPRPGKDALWVQAEGPLRNPFYGSEMLECGTEVR